MILLDICNHVEYYAPKSYNNTAIETSADDMQPWKQEQTYQWYNTLLQEDLIFLKYLSVYIVLRVVSFSGVLL